MEKSKKIVCIVLIICALFALCAVGASAEHSYEYDVSSSGGTVTVYKDGTFLGSVTMGIDYYPVNGVVPSFVVYDSFNIRLDDVVSSFFSDSYFDLTYTYYCGFGRSTGLVMNQSVLSDFFNSFDFGLLPLNSIPSTYSSDFTSLSSLCSSYSSTLESSNFTVISSTLSLVECTFHLTGHFLSSSIEDFSRFSACWTVTPSLVGSQIVGFGALRSDVNGIVGTSTSFDPNPTPDPSVPSSDGGSLLDGFQWARNIGYYASFSPLLNSSTLEPSYLGVTRMSRLPYDQITDSKFQAPSSSNGCALIMGQKTDYDDILVSGTVGYGVCAMLVTSPFKLDSSTLGVDYSSQIFFASGDDPSASGYTQVDASTLGLEEYTVRVWTIDYNEWSKIVMCRYYFVLDLGVSTPSFPTDTISVQFKSTAVHTHEWYWTPFDFRFQYALRESESDPLPDSVTNYNPATGSPTSTGGYNTSESTVSDNLNQEAEWASKYAENIIFKNVGGIMDNLNELVDTALFGNNLESLESLKNALTYSSTGGTLYLPSATIPFGGSQLHLWDRQAIPFSDYINQIPSAYTTIISFLLIVGGWFAFVAIWFNTFRKLLSGDVRNERF